MLINITKEIILSALKEKIQTAEELNAIKRRILRGVKGLKEIPTTAVLLQAYHKLLKENKIKRSEQMEFILTKRAVRTLSGVSIITVLTRPAPCPGTCIYCPNERAMPKSYISDEPAAARALALHFDPFEQVARRIASLEANGHPTDKIELIVKGGTWNAYPLEYQYWFILRCFEAANRLSSRAKSRDPLSTSQKKILRLSQNDIVLLKQQLTKIQKKNELAPHRVVGLTLETRPDHIDEKNITIMREIGCTRVELGVQTIDDKILQSIKRGHDAHEVARATELLKNHGFKVDFHLMPQLPGSTPKKDLEMLSEIFTNEAYRPDMIKIYPCTVVENSELYEWLKAKKYKPYSNGNLIDVIKKFKTQIPRYTRVSRVIRDIPAHHIKAGNTMTNLRQVIQSEMKAEGLKCKCLRCREIGHNEKFKNQKEKSKIFRDIYNASNGTEYFLSFEDSKREVVFAFCRLRIFDGKAFIRELHVYGQSLSIGFKNKKAGQHRGLGKKLILETEKICKKNKISFLAVISGVGVRDYYRHLGFKLQKTYMVKKLSKR